MMLRYLWLVLWTLLTTGVAQAANVNFNGNVSGCSRNGSTYTCAPSFLGANDTAVIGNGTTVIVTGAFQLGFFQGLKMSGSARLETTAGNALDLSGAQQQNLDTGGATLKAGGNFRIGGSRQNISANVIATTVDVVGEGSTITGTITATGAVNLVSRTEVTGAVAAGNLTTDSNVTIGGGITATGAISLQSGSVVTGTVKGDSITTASSVTINGAVDVNGQALFESRSVVQGAVDAGALVLRSEAATINGKVTVTGDVTLGNTTVINGDLEANNVRTEDSNARINGNALVSSLYFGYGGTVSKVVTCKAPGAAPCSCVTYQSTYTYRPTCAAPAPASAHHFQITHGGSALTCQPQTVRVTACANAACSAPHFTGNSTVTLQPGGKSFSFAGETGSATVEQTTAGTATLAIAGATGTTCVNTANGAAANRCAMAFDDTGLLVSVDNHIAMTTANVRIQALAAAGNKQSCVPLVAGRSENIDASCAFVNPAPGSARAGAQVTLNGAGLSCGGATARVLLAFDRDGIATTTLTYPETGQVSLTAAYAGSAGYKARGTDSFIAAPARFTIAATSAGGRNVAAGAVVTATSAVFAKAGEAFTVRISAVNDKGAVTTNFGKEATPENMAVTPVVDNPDGTGDAGIITPGAWNPITEGVSSSKTDSTGQWRFSDVGIVRLDVGLASGTGYLGVNTTSSTGSAGFRTAGTQMIGRFIPDHFKTSLPVAAADATPEQDEVPSGQLTGMTMPCKAGTTSPALLAPCDAAFVYSYQPFYVVVKAYNSANAVTSNYQGPLARTITLSAATANGGATLVPGSVGTLAGSETNTAPVFGFAKGIGKVTGASLPTFRFNAPPSATTGTSPYQFFVRAADTDAATSLRTGAGEQAITAVSGRLVVPNIAGSPASSLPVTVQAQFYDASRGFVFNPRYGAPASGLAGYLRFDRCQKGLSSNPATFACTTAAQLQPVAPGSAAFQAGKATFRLMSPGRDVGGAVNLTLQKPCTPAPSCNAAAQQWNAYLPSTTGKLTFGIYGGGPVIYSREVY